MKLQGESKRGSLRKRAEKILSQKQQDLQKAPVEDTKRLIHELEVHQIELDMQNDELRRAQAEIELSRAKYVDLYDFAPIGYFTFSQQGLILEANLAGAKLLKVERRLLIRQPFIRFVSADFHRMFHSYLERVLSTGTKQTSELKLIRKGGSAFWVSMESISSKDNEAHPIQCRSAISDITERKQGEQELQKAHDRLEIRVEKRTEELVSVNESLEAEITERKEAEEQLGNLSERLRALAAHLQSIREEERTAVAREIHDELGQALTGLNMDLSWLSKKLPKDQELIIEKAKSMQTLIDSTIQTVRKIATELRPGVLDDLGLVAAVEWQAQYFQDRAGIRCEFSSGLEEIHLEPNCTTAVFRILQETLTNVTRHANATVVSITLAEDVGNLVLKVEDNGRGITGNEISSPKSLGLLGMRERALVFGGKLEITGKPGKGTTVILKIPLHE